MPDENIKDIAQALQSHSEKLWKNKEMLRKVENNIRFIFIIKLVLTAMDIFGAMVYTYIYASTGFSSLNSFQMGTIQSMLSVLLVIPAYFALAKNMAASVVLVVVHAVASIFAVVFDSPFTAVSGAIGAIAYSFQLFELAKYQFLSEQEGFPYFNERLEEYLCGSDYDPQCYILPENRSGDMDELTPEDRHTFEALMHESISKAFEAFTPEMEPAEVICIAEDEVLTDSSFATSEEVRKHTEKLALIKRRQEERVEAIIRAERREAENHKNKEQ